MKAVVYDHYGGPEVLRVTDVPRPQPERGKVSVRVRAVSINAADYRTMRANPFLVRLDNGLFRPKKRILGGDFAGVVEEVGQDVANFKPGDAVFGDAFQDGLGGLAEYVTVQEGVLALKPDSLSFEEAASLPLPAITAIQAVRDRAKIESGQKCLIQGAGGGVGLTLVQIAKAYGAHVTAVCGPGSAALATSLGADRIIDYTREDFTDGSDQYDAIFGVNGYHSLKEYRAHLSETGIYVMIGGKNRQIFEALILGKMRFSRGERRIAVLTLDDTLHKQDLTEAQDLVAAGRLKPVIDRTLPLDSVVEAFRYVEEGHVRGKVVLTIPNGA